MSPSVFLNGATIMTTATDRSLRVARQAGFAGIEARAERLLGSPDEVRTAAKAVRDGEVWSLNGVRLSLHPDGAIDAPTLRADLGPRLRITRELRASYLLAVPPRIAGLSPQQALAGIEAGLVLARDLAAEQRVKVAFEFLGFADCPINSPALAAEVVAGVEGVDLVLDSCHWHASGSRSLDELPIQRLAMVHLNDAPAKPPRELEDADRVLPLEGVIALPELVRDLTRLGFRGPWSLETFNPAYWEQGPLEIARRGRAALDRLFAQAGLESG
ncbi:MAG: sugar phosphate isomerase/epimerase [Chloroflexi bacterium]|nr:MAG: sugar phosphate isomerase/epimerase [Chloroflexota bacterium]